MPFLAMHVAALGVLFTGVHPIDIVLCAVCYVARMVGITAGYHRYFSHRSYKTSRPFQFVLAVLGCSALQKGPIWWTAHHRSHHRFSDTDDDPHSPHSRSVWWSHMGWILARDYEEVDVRKVRDWGRYPELRWLDRHYWVPGTVLGFLCWLIGGWSGLFCGFFLSTVLLYHAVFAVNSLCHLLGRRRYVTGDMSRNNLFVALITLGEGWHNNHHHYQSSANQGFFWYEVDLCYYMIRVLGWIGFVWDIRRPPVEKLRSSRRAVVNAVAELAGRVEAMRTTIAEPLATSGGRLLASIETSE